MIKKIILILLALLMLAGCSKENEEEKWEINISDFRYKGDEIKYPWYENYKVIAHALGGIDDVDYTNSYEALVTNYNNGTRVFETDFSYTSDGELVLLHEWSQYHNTFGLGEYTDWEKESSEYFENNLIYDKYHTLKLRDLVYIMSEIPDFYVVIDSKTFDVAKTEKMYGDFVEIVSETNPELLKRFIPQAYSEETYLAIKDSYDFDDIILTLYSIYAESDGDTIYHQIVSKYQIKNVVCHMDNDWAKKVIRDVKAYSTYEEWGRENVKIFIHTINDEDIAKSIINDEGFNGIYSDFITEKKFNKIIDD